MAGLHLHLRGRRVKRWDVISVQSFQMLHAADYAIELLHILYETCSLRTNFAVLVT